MCIARTSPLILLALWPESYTHTYATSGDTAEVFSRTVDMHVGSLRQKIEVHPKKPQLILTVPGLGYKFMG
jgi:two-component system response regulator RegX3